MCPRNKQSFTSDVPDLDGLRDYWRWSLCWLRSRFLWDPVTVLDRPRERNILGYSHLWDNMLIRGTKLHNGGEYGKRNSARLVRNTPGDNLTIVVKCHSVVDQKGAWEHLDINKRHRSMSDHWITDFPRGCGIDLVALNLISTIREETFKEYSF